MQDGPLVGRGPFDGSYDVLTSAKGIRRDDHDVHWHADVVERHPDLDGFVATRSLDGHHDQEVDVAVRPRVAAPMGAEQDDAFGIEPLDDPTDHLPDHAVDRRQGA